MREEPIHVRVQGPCGEPFEPAAADCPSLPQDPLTVTARLDRVPTIVEDPVIRDAKVSDHNEVDNDLPFEESLGQGNRYAYRIRARVLLSGGSPARGVYVTLRKEKEVWLDSGRTDGDGVVEFRNLPREVYVLAVEEAGFIQHEPLAVVPGSGDLTEVTVREDDGLPMGIEVVDGEGRPLPGASVEVPFVVIEDGVQRVGLVTGPDGRLRIARAPRGTWSVAVRYGTRFQRKSVEAGGRAVFRLARRKEK
jgi:hypothetical protein